MTNTIAIDELRLGGFRAFLRPQGFSLFRKNKPLSLAIFAPNAKGKSSLIDAFEFYFSDEGTLARLGIRTARGNAGRRAMEHIDAKANGMIPEVHFSFREESEKFSDKRIVTSKGSPIPIAAKRVLSNCTLPFIIRGYELRGFVEDQTSEDRYNEMAAWFGLDPLLKIQKNLRVLRRQIKQNAESTAQREERLRDLARITGNAVTAGDDAIVCKWFDHEVLANLDTTLTLAAVSETDEGYQEVKKRKIAEDKRIGLASLNIFLTQIEVLHRVPLEEAEDPTGAILNFESAVSAYANAISKEAKERAEVKISGRCFYIYIIAACLISSSVLAIKSFTVLITPSRLSS
jgi:hypothetical protein